MKLPGCGLLSATGCLIVGALIGALVIWLLIPRFQARGYTPDRATEKIEESIGEITEFTGEKSRRLSEEAERLNSLVRPAGVSAAPAAKAPAAPPEPVLVVPSAGETQ